MFKNDNYYYLWGISKNGIGLIGTVIMNYLSTNNGMVFNSLDELEEYLKNKIDKEKNMK
ncbi:MAG: hypothetical protein IJE45_02950 [Bacilli bacterium]|nr:hypothetical protein [Bacilli bacterium]